MGLGWSCAGRPLESPMSLSHRGKFPTFFSSLMDGNGEPMGPKDYEQGPASLRTPTPWDITTEPPHPWLAPASSILVSLEPWLW